VYKGHFLENEQAMKVGFNNAKGRPMFMNEVQNVVQGFKERCGASFFRVTLASTARTKQTARKHHLSPQKMALLGSEARTWSSGKLPAKEKNYEFEKWKWSLNEEWGVCVRENDEDQWTYITQFDKPARQETGRGSRSGKEYLGFDGVYLDIKNYEKMEDTPDEIDYAIALNEESDLSKIKSMLNTKAKYIFGLGDLNKLLKGAKSTTG
jgi:cell division protein FtsI/penicillin-binding protein 2